mgnify:CR=1 FL=1
MEQLLLNPIAKVDGEINLPGSKSLSNRALLLAALAQGTTTLTNLLDSDDIRHMLNALKKLGVDYQLSDDRSRCRVNGLGRAFVLEQAEELFLGNAGTAMRPLAAVLAFSSVSVELTGEPRMFERPIGHLVDALLPLGANIEYLGDTDFPPLKLTPFEQVDCSEVNIEGSVSSQFLSALFLFDLIFSEFLVVDLLFEIFVLGFLMKPVSSPVF